MKKTIWRLLFAMLLLFTSAIGLLAEEKSEEESNDAVEIKKLVLVRDAGETLKEVSQYKPNDKFWVLVLLNELKEGTTIKVVWTIVDAGGEKNKKMYEDSETADAEMLKKAKATDRVDFSLRHTNPLSPGDYKVEAYLNGKLAATKDFKVEE